MVLPGWLILLVAWLSSAALTAGDFQTANRAGIISNASGDYCSGVMISAREVLTAAHCLFDGAGVPVPVASLKYQAENIGTLEVEGLAIHPAFVYQSGDIATGIEADVALIQVKNNRADLSSIEHAKAVYRGDMVFVQRGMAGLVERCSVTNAVRQIFTLNCAAIEGESGAAIYLIGTSGAHKLVGVVSAIEMHQESRLIIGVLVGESVDSLRAILERGE